MRSVNNKQICCDDITRRFLLELRSLRKRKGLSQSGLAKMLEVNEMTIRRYELGKTIPHVARLNKLAEILDYDISDSVNYRFHHNKICGYDLRSRIERYGFSNAELQEITGYSARMIRAIRKYHHDDYNVSLIVLDAVNQVLNDEQEHALFRDRLICKSRSEERRRNKGS